MSLGPVMLDIAGTELLDEDRDLLTEPAVGGVILFSRNFSDAARLRALCAEIHALRSPPLLIAVDQEGGRIQRFRDGFTALPAARTIGHAYDNERKDGLELACECGWMMAAELLAVGVDLSFAPVLDLDRGNSSVIGDRAFHRDPRAVSELAAAYARGMREAGMPAVGKHYPGHGFVSADSHTSLPVDPRPAVELREDFAPFEYLVRNGIPALMTAHVVYRAVDRYPASLSSRWIENRLRTRLGFSGAVVSDDLSMEGAAIAGDKPSRARRALDAGSDVILVCNDRLGARAVVRSLHDYVNPVGQVRRMRLHGRPTTRGELTAQRRWRAGRDLLATLVDGEPDAQPGLLFDA